MIKEICMGLAMLLALTGCNDSKKVNLVEQKETFWEANIVYLYNEQNPNMRLKLTIPKGIHQPYYMDKKNSDGSYDEEAIFFYFEPEELDAFVNKDAISVLKIKEIKKNSRGDYKKYDFGARNFEVQLWMSSTPVDSAYFERQFKIQKFDNSFIPNKNWLVSIDPRPSPMQPNALIARIELFHSSGLYINLIGSRQLDGEKVSPKRDQIIKNVIAMIDSFNPELSK